MYQNFKLLLCCAIISCSQLLSSNWGQQVFDAHISINTLFQIEFDLLQDAMKSPLNDAGHNERIKELYKQVLWYMRQIELTQDAEKYYEDLQRSVENLHKEEDSMVDHMQSTLPPVDYYKLRSDLHVIQYEVVREFDFFGLKAKLTKLFYKHASSHLRESLLADNPYKDVPVQVRQDSGLLVDEQIFRARRAPTIKAGLTKFFGNDAPQKLTIGFVGSGGGYRAMMMTSGYMKALEDLGLLDATMYVTSLSGSTWLLAPWIYKGGTMQEYQLTLIGLINRGWLDIKNVSTILCSNPTRFVHDVVWPKFLFSQSMSSIDLYGALLAMVLFSSEHDERHKMRLSEQMGHIATGNMPFPIYTSVSMQRQDDDTYRYSWYEFNPLEVRNLDLDLTIPSWSFDSQFNRGALTELAPEQSMGYLLGIFGSAYTVNFSDLYRLMYQEIEKAPSWSDPVDRIKFKVCKGVVALMSNIPVVGKKRFSPAQVNNPFKNCEGCEVPSWLANRDEIVFVDGGIAYNLPIRPLLRPARNVDVIIIGDSSANISEGKELRRFFKDAYATYGYEYTRADDGSNATLGLYHCTSHEQAPVIIYINFLVDHAVIEKCLYQNELVQLIQEYNLSSFDPVKCVEDDYCSTFNFGYSEEQFKQVAAIAEFNVKSNASTIRKFILEECCS